MRIIILLLVVIIGDHFKATISDSNIAIVFIYALGLDLLEAWRS